MLISGCSFQILLCILLFSPQERSYLKEGITEINSVEQAAKALEPLAGKLSYLLFALGIIGTGMLAIPVLTGCLSYILSETFNWKGDLDKKYYEAKPFYWVIIISLLIGLAINYIGINPIQALLYTAILYGVTSPVLIGVILHISNNKKVMGNLQMASGQISLELLLYC
jgi:Mn2+/Fe2+ NRAMP family transporter